MFEIRIYKNKQQLLDVLHYKAFQNALADIIEHQIFQRIPYDSVGKLEDNPRMLWHSVSEKTGIKDDFEFRYSNGITVAIGEIHFEDEGEHYE